MSIEPGQRVELGGVWSLTLQAQLSYPSVTDAFTDTFGTMCLWLRATALLAAVVLQLNVR
ncbi:hypothetical protein [Brucella intermedia]|uniref:hypothetical protein n=1 Tax=Brucella intermedia TaxID=94625 RepID=UPI0023617655|nr:hypothetical protein [Brucella intermedia]